MFCLRMFKTGIVATICLFNAEYEFSSGIIVHTRNKRNERESCPAIDSIEKKKERGVEKKRGGRESCRPCGD